VKKIGKNIDLTGKKFGRLTVIAEESLRKKIGYKKWICKCDCGKYITTQTRYLTSGDTKSCGCLLSDTSKKYYSQLNKTHGMSHSKLHVKWQGMRDRCYRENTNGYENYGGRGIKVCDEWKKDFNNFYKWAIETGYKEGMTIDRIDVNGNYEPSNCRWATHKEQSNNKRNSHFIEYKGERHTLKQWSEKLGVSYSTIKCRSLKGWSNEEILLGRNK